MESLPPTPHSLIRCPDPVTLFYFGPSDYLFLLVGSLPVVLKGDLVFVLPPPRLILYFFLKNSLPRPADIPPLAFCLSSFPLLSQTALMAPPAFFFHSPAGDPSQDFSFILI